MAGPFLKAAVNSYQAVIDEIEVATRELRIAMFASGHGKVAALRHTKNLICVD
jgi:isopentenyl-diphosphate Delta-isomerase